IHDDATIQPNQWLVLDELEPSGSVSQAPGHEVKMMLVDDGDKPSVSIDGHSSGAEIKLDTEDDSSKLVKVELGASYDGMLKSAILSWSPELRLWKTDKIGNPGDDLGSQAVAN